MDAHQLRNQIDKKLADQLLADEHVQAAVKTAEKLLEEGGTRRQLLAQALRLTPSIAPDLYGILARCNERLGVETEVELYIYASPTYNAACTQQEGDRVFVLLSSSLREALDDEELAFVIGHELGHHIYGHHAIPLHILMSPQQPAPPQLVLTAHSWLRHAEISADRAGMMCCDGLSGAARSLFKLSSGLQRAPTDAQIEAFLEQAHELYAESTSEKANHTDWLSTHPFSPVRLRAAQVFARSGVFQADGPSMDRVELEVMELMALMEPSYLEGRTPTDEAMRRLVFAAGIVLAAADGEIQDQERQALEAMLGAGTLPRRPDIPRLKQLVTARAQDVVERAPPARRAKLLQDLALIARADGRTAPEEIAMLEQLARDLQVDPALVSMSLGCAVEVD